MLCLRKGKSGSQDKNGTHGCVSHRDEQGFAVLIALIALSIFSVLGMYMSVNAMTEVRISDNYESKLQASYAARAGIDHVRNLLASDPIQFNDLLNGPDGVPYSTSTSYMTQARTQAFRNPLTWQTARSLDILDPSSAVNGLPDDGIVNTGRYGTTNGTVLVPLTGIALTSPDPYGSGNIITSRYFVKVTDNTGDVTERTAAGTVPGQQDDPFVDSDGTIIIRSMGIAGTIREAGGGTVRANSVSVYEMRFRRSRSFAFDSPLTLEGDNIIPESSNMWDGNAFQIDGQTNYGVATIDPNLANGTPVNQVTSGLTTAQKKSITGKGGIPSVGDITTSLTGDGLNLLNAGYLWNFTQNEVPTFADGIYPGGQSWSGNSQPYVGYFDPNKDLNDPSQDPKVTLVNGDLSLGGGFNGGGLLVVTGSLSGNGNITWNGLIFVIGKGEVNFSGMNVSMTGGLYVVNVQPDANGVPQFGTVKFTMAGSSKFLVSDNTSRMLTAIIPPRQTSYREVTSLKDAT